MNCVTDALECVCETTSMHASNKAALQCLRPVCQVNKRQLSATPSFQLSTFCQVDSEAGKLLIFTSFSNESEPTLQYA